MEVVGVFVGGEGRKGDLARADVFEKFRPGGGKE